MGVLNFISGESPDQFPCFSKVPEIIQRSLDCEDGSVRTAAVDVIREWLDNRKFINKLFPPSENKVSTLHVFL